MSAQPQIIKIQRGQYSPRIQLVRAWLSAVSALISTEPDAAIGFIEKAILELRQLRVQLGGRL